MKKLYTLLFGLMLSAFAWAQAPVVSITASSTQVCAGSTLTLTANSNISGSTFLWSTGATTSAIFVNPNSNTTYSCIVTANGLSSSASQAISVLANPTANAGTDFTKTCVSNANGAFIGMIAQPGVTYSWSPTTALSSGTAANPTANPTATTTYTLTATHTQSGCVATDAVVVTVNQTLPIADAGLDGEKTCAQNSTGVQIGALPQSGQTYAWTPSTGLSATGVANPIANPSTTTNYTLTVTNVANGCTATDQVLVSVNTTLPTANAGLDFTKTCVSNSYGLAIGQVTASGVTYSWSPSTGLSSATVSNPTANPSATTTYTLTATQVSSGCTATDQVLVSVNQQVPVANAGVDLLKTCTQNNAGATLGSAALTGCTYSWSPSTGLSSATTSTPFANPTQTTTYTVTVTQASSGCTSTDQMTFDVNVATPTANAGFDFNKTCLQNTNGLQIGSTAVAGYTYTWFPTLGLSSSTLSNPIANPTQSTSYLLTVTDQVSGCTATDQVAVTVNTTAPTANAGADFTKTCVSNANGAFIGMIAQAGVTYSWSPTTALSSGTAANPTANPTATTTYTLTATNTQSGCVATDAVVVTVNQTLPIADAGLDGEKTCAQNSTGVQIGALPQTGQTYSWSPSTGLSATGVANPIANPSTTTNYTLTVTNVSNGCTATDQVLVSVNTTLPTANAGLDFTKTCVSNSNGLAIGQTAASGVTYSWSPSTGLSSATVSNPTANPSATTTYTLTATQVSSGCTATDQVLVTVNQQVPVANAGVDLLKTCTQNNAGATLGSAALSGCTYSWSPSTGLSSATTSTPFANPTQTTTYTVTVTQASSGCTSTDQMTFDVNVATPIANAGVDFNKTCLQNTNGLQIGSTAVAGYTYNWFPTLGLSSSTVSNPIANPTQSTSYLLTVTDQISGCTATDQVAVTVNTTAPTANAGTDFTKTCVSNTAGLLIGAGTTAGNTYSWSPSTGLSSATISNPLANPSVTTTYTLTVNNPATGCSATDVVIVTVNQTPPLAAAGPDFLKNCYQNFTGSVIGMTPVTGNSYQWSPIAGLNFSTAANPVANPAITTTYTLTVTNVANGCVATDQIIVTVDIATPSANAGNDFSINCFGNSAGASIGTNPAPGITYSWTPVAGLSATATSNTWANPNQTTTYTLTALNPINGCSSTDQVLVSVNLTAPIANAGPDKLKNCSINTAGAQIGTLAQAQTNYSWSPTTALSTPNAAQTWANPSQSMWYVLTATNWASGCTDIDSVYFEVNVVQPIIEAGLNQSVCLGDSILVSATYPTGTQMSWNNGIQNNQYFIPTVSQYYTLTVIATNGCQSQDSLFVQVNPLPAIYAGQDIEVCAGQTVTLAGSFGTIYYWSGGIQNGVSFIPTTSGAYSVTGLDINGCQNTDLVLVTVHANPVVSAGVDPALCLGDSVLLSATGALNYSWSNGMANGSYITPNFTTLLEVTGTNQFGCTGSDLFEITVNQPTYSTLNVVFQGPYTLNGITYNQSGTYTQVIPNAAGCDSTITLNYELVDVGVEDIALQTIEAYPNPFNDQIWMTYDENLIGEVLFLLDLSGRVLEQYELSADLKMQLELGAFPTGTYLLSTRKTLPIRIVKL